MKSILVRFFVAGFLFCVTAVAYGAAFHGWFLPRPLDKPVSLREGSTPGRTHGGGYFIGGRSHAGGGYGGGGK